MAHAVEQLRSAPNAAKAPLLRALERQPCESEDVCELKRVCVAAYRDQLGALDGARALEHALSGDAAAPPPASAAALVESSEHRLEAARAGARHCAELQGALSRRYKF